MDVSKTAVGLSELSETCLGVSGDLGLLAGDAGGCPGFDIGSDVVPYILLFEELDCCSSGGMGESMDDVENGLPEGGRNPWSRIACARVTQYNRSIRHLDVLEVQRGMLRLGRGGGHFCCSSARAQRSNPHTVRALQFLERVSATWCQVPSNSMMADRWRCFLLETGSDFL